MTGRTFTTITCVLTSVLLAPLVQADTTLTMKDLSGKTDSIIEVKGHMIRMSTPGDPDYMLYDAKRDVAIHVNGTNKQYMEIDRASMAKMAESVAQVRQEIAPQMEMMREQLKNLPPEQRAMIEQQLGGSVNLSAMESKPAAKVTTVKRGTDKIAGFNCQRYDVMKDKARVGDVCIATDTGPGMSKADFSTVRSAMKFMRDMAKSAEEMAAGMGGPEMTLGDVDGVPVSAKDLRNGREYLLVKVSDADLDNARFNAYRSMKKEELPSIR